MIREAKKLLDTIIRKRIREGMPIADSIALEAQCIMARKFPFVALVTNPGRFDESAARTVRYKDDAGQYRERYVRGNRILPILIRCWADGEEKADALCSAIMAAIPSQWAYDDFCCRIEIKGEEHSDHAGQLNAPYVSVIEVEFTGTSALPPEEVPVIESTEVEGEYK